MPSMNGIKVSIIVPIYKVEAFLGKCLDSIVAQTYSNLEVILVEDGGPDQSGAICDAYAAKDSRIIVIHKGNEGVSKARLDGCRKATGEYVTFVDADDYIAPNYVETLLTEAVDGDFDMVACQYVTLKEGVEKEDHRPVVGHFDKEGIKSILKDSFLFDHSIGKSGINVFLWSKLYRRDIILDAMPHGVGLSFGEDMVINFEMMRRINSLSVIDQCLYYYVQHSGQVTRKQFIYQWNKYVKCWRKLISMDEEKLLDAQMPDRIWLRLRPLVLIICKYSDTYQDFATRLQEISDTKDIMAYIYRQRPRTKFQLFYRVILRNRLFHLGYCLLRMRHPHDKKITESSSKS